MLSNVFVCFVFMYLLFRFSLAGVHLFSLSLLLLPNSASSFSPSFLFLLSFLFMILFIVFFALFFHVGCWFYSSLNTPLCFPFLPGDLYFCLTSSYAFIFSLNYASAVVSAFLFSLASLKFAHLTPKVVAARTCFWAIQCRPRNVWHAASFYHTCCRCLRTSTTSELEANISRFDAHIQLP